MDEKQRLCLACMECCKILLVPLPADPHPWVSNIYRMFFSPPATDFYNKRGCKPWTDAQGHKWLVVEFPCPYLCDITGCTIYQDRPKFCREGDARRDPYLKHICKWKDLDD